MTTYTFNNDERQNQEKGVSFPFSEIYKKILDEFIEESRKEMLKRVNNNERKD